MELLEDTTTPPCSPVEQPPISKEDRVGSPDHLAGGQGTSLTLEAIEEVAGTTSAVLAGLSTAALLPEDRTEAMTSPTLKDPGLESSHGVERVDAVGHLPAADGAGIVGGVDSLGAVAQSLEVFLGQTVANPKFGLFLRKRVSRWPSGHGDFLGGIEELKALSLKKCRRHSNEAFRVSCVMTLFVVIVLRAV